MTGIPPSNIEQIGEDAFSHHTGLGRVRRKRSWRITLEDRQLVIEGGKPDDSEGRAFLHRGIPRGNFSAVLCWRWVEVAGTTRIGKGLTIMSICTARCPTSACPRRALRLTPKGLRELSASEAKWTSTPKAADPIVYIRRSSGRTCPQERCSGKAPRRSEAALLRP